jgi:hypothetical protein
MNLKELKSTEDEYLQQQNSKEITKQFLKLPKTKREAILTAAIVYETMNQQEKLIKARRDAEIRPIVEGAADAYGIEDENESLHLVLDKDTEIVRIKKTSMTMNEMATEKILKDSGIYDSCVIQVVSWEIDEEKIIEAYNAGLLSATDLEKMYSKNVTYSTKVNTDVEEVKTIEKMRKEIEKSKKGEMKNIES